MNDWNNERRKFAEYNSPVYFSPTYDNIAGIRTKLTSVCFILTLFELEFEEWKLLPWNGDWFRLFEHVCTTIFVEDWILLADRLIIRSQRRHVEIWLRYDDREVLKTFKCIQWEHFKQSVQAYTRCICVIKNRNSITENRLYTHTVSVLLKQPNHESFYIRWSYIKYSYSAHCTHCVVKYNRLLNFPCITKISLFFSHFLFFFFFTVIKIILELLYCKIIIDCCKTKKEFAAKKNYAKSSEFCIVKFFKPILKIIVIVVTSTG